MMMTASTPPKPGFFARLFASRDDAGSRLYAAIVAEARRPEWYAQLGVRDTIDGRFDAVCLVLSLVLLTLERERCDAEAVRLTEIFIDDMDGQIREIGFGDLSVGKQVGGIMALLGGRLGAYRTGLDRATLERTLWRGTPPPPAVVDATMRRIGALRADIDAVPIDRLLDGALS